MLPNKISSAQIIPPNNTVYILNLSTIHKLAPISAVLNHFAKLHLTMRKVGCILNGIASFG